MKMFKLAGIASALFFTATAQAQTVTLKVAHFLPSISNAHVSVIAPWCDKIKAESNGRIACQIYPSMQLGGTPATLADQVRNGVADIVWTAPSYSAGKFPRIEALELPFVLPYGAKASNDLIWSFYEKYAKADFKDYKVLAIFGDGGMDVHTRGGPVRSAKDFAGLKLRASGRTAARTLETLGATPVSMPPAQMTEAISKGVVDGAFATWEVVKPTKLDEVTKYHSAMAEGKPAMGYTVLTILMNQRKFDSLPADLKAIIDRNSGKTLVDWFGAEWDRYIVESKKEANKDTIIPISDAAFAEIQQVTAKVGEEWAADANKRGIDGKQLLQAAQQLMKK